MTKHGFTTLFIPGHDAPVDITIYLNVALNPGPIHNVVISDQVNTTSTPIRTILSKLQYTSSQLK